MAQKFVVLCAGYYSNLALELEGTFESVLELDLTGLPSDEQEAWLKDPARLDAVVDQPGS